MGVDTTQAHDHASTNALDDLPDDLLSTPPAYYRLGSTPCALVDPLAAEDTGVYCIRVRCTGEHGPLIRKDGERRYERSLVVQAIWKMGDPEPPDPTAEQPALFGADGDAQNGWEYPEGEGQAEE